MAKYAAYDKDQEFLFDFECNESIDDALKVAKGMSIEATRVEIVSENPTVPGRFN